MGDFTFTVSCPLASVGSEYDWLREKVVETNEAFLDRFGPMLQAHRELDQVMAGIGIIGELQSDFSDQVGSSPPRDQWNCFGLEGRPGAR